MTETEKKARRVAWFNAERQRKIKDLLAASTRAERRRIQHSRREGRRLRLEAQKL